MALDDVTGAGKPSCWTPILTQWPNRKKIGPGKTIDIPEISFKHHLLRHCLAKTFCMCVAHCKAWPSCIQFGGATSAVFCALHAAVLYDPASFA